MSEAVIETSGLTKRYSSSLALDSVSLTVNQGDIYGLVGRNGAGKTTFFKTVLGLARPTAGTVSLFGQSTGLPKLRSRIGFLITASFFPYLNAEENLRYLSQAGQINAASEIPKLIELVGLTGVKKPYKSYSYGMKQRLGIAAALLGSPDLVILDEPINGLDPQGIIDIRGIIKDYSAQSGATLVVSSHILSELDLVATRFGFLEQGRLVQQISHADLHEQTKNALIVETNDPTRACTLLQEAGVADIQVDGKRLVMNSSLDAASRIARLLVEGGLELQSLHLQETTLEAYFMRLIGSPDA